MYCRAGGHSGGIRRYQFHVGVREGGHGNCASYVMLMCGHCYLHHGRSLQSKTNDQVSFEESLHKIGSFNTVEGFFRYVRACREYYILHRKWYVYICMSVCILHLFM